jgi:hypothetical protein
MSAKTRRHQGNKDPRLKEGTISEKREDIRQNLRETHVAGDRETSSRIFCRVTKNEELDIVEGLAPTETEKEFAPRVTARNVSALANLGSFAP